MCVFKKCGFFSLKINSLRFLCTLERSFKCNQQKKIASLFPKLEKPSKVRAQIFRCYGLNPIQRPSGRWCSKSHHLKKIWDRFNETDRASSTDWKLTCGKTRLSKTPEKSLCGTPKRLPEGCRAAQFGHNHNLENCKKSKVEAL